jgi:hypothetical protein
MRLLGATLPALPIADEGKKYGNPIALAAIPADLLKNPLRFI